MLLDGANSQYTVDMFSSLSWARWMTTFLASVKSIWDCGWQSFATASICCSSESCSGSVYRKRLPR